MLDDHEPQPTQQTRARKGESIEIPVPKKGDVLDFLKSTAKPPDPERSDDWLARGLVKQRLRIEQNVFLFARRWHRVRYVECDLDRHIYPLTGGTRALD
jgi:hypothetical protein